MDWIEVVLKTTTQGADIMAQILYEAGANGAVIEDPADIRIHQRAEGQWDYIDESILEGMDEEVLVKGYLPDNEKLHDQLQYIKDRIINLSLVDLEGLDLGSKVMELHNVKEEDWANGWKKYYKPFHAGKHIVIKPTWETYEAGEGDIVIELDPGMAFGTGTHETTAMCIQLLEMYVKPDMKMIDVGCGTGILSIAAAKLGAGHVLAIDLDPTSVKVTRENIKLNHLEDRISAEEGNLLDKIGEKADLIVANIIADVIIKLSSPAKQLLNDNGVFIVSGIIRDRADEVQEKLLKDGFCITDTLSMGEWVAYACRK